ncbi:MAG: 2-oxoacid:acceptor oxidoreductase family protein [Dehalococcoidia bacterium]
MARTPLLPTRGEPSSPGRDGASYPNFPGLIEIRWHGRSGQGVITASELLAEAALREHRYFQAFPEFGAERTGAPVIAYSRLSDLPITLHAPIVEPDIVVVLEPTLLKTVDVLYGLKEEGLVLVNTSLRPAELRAQLPAGRYRLYVVPATRIALDNLGRNFPNTALLGALLRVAPVVKKKSALEAMKKRLASRPATPMVEANILALERGYGEVREE